MVSALPLLLAALSIVGPSPATAAPQFGGQGRLFTGAHNARNPLREHLKRSVTSDASSVKGRSFDFVIVGGGVAGLTLANRLSEWGNQSVLVIEAGGDGSDVEERQSVPGYAYHKGLSSKSPYAWNFTTSPQAECFDTVKNYPLGRGLGGSGAVNGMFWGRAANSEYDAWANLNPGGEQTWNWQTVDRYIKKSETLLPPRADQVAQFKIPFDTSAHGTDGPLKIGWSNYIYPVVERWIPTWQALGFSAIDHATGSTRGVTITPSTLDSSTGKRTTSRTAYIDGVTRTNLVVLTDQQVTKVVFSGKDAQGNVNATGVECSPYSGGETFSITATKEVILSCGSINSPTLLQRSGVGPADLLGSMNIPVVSELPVGFNFQEHVAFAMFFDTVTGFDTWNNLAADPALAEAALAQWRENGTGPWTYVNEAVGYVNGADIGGGQVAVNTFADQIDIEGLVKQMTTRLNLPASVAKGLRTQYYIQRDWLKADIGQFEIIFHLWGKSSTSLGFQVALQHPWSRGRVSISSADPFAMPVIDPDYFNADVDVENMNNAALWTRKMVSTPPMGDIMLNESAPGTNYSGSSLSDYFKQSGGTEYHPLGTCAMLPKSDGGVVDTNLRVYGTNNLRVVDASIMPLQISAHLMASTYGVAEFAADIIKSQNVFVPPPQPSPSTTATPSTSASTSATSDASAAAAGGGSSSGKLSTRSIAIIAASSAAGALALAGLIALVVIKKKKNKPTGTDFYSNVQPDRTGLESYPLTAGLRHRPQDSMSTMATNELHPQRPARGESLYSLGPHYN